MINCNVCVHVACPLEPAPHEEQETDYDENRRDVIYFLVVWFVNDGTRASYPNAELVFPTNRYRDRRLACVTVNRVFHVWKYKPYGYDTRR